MTDETTDAADICVSMKELYARYGAAMVAVLTVDKDGDEHIGSAFHVGEGAFVTARHVAEGRVSCRVQIDSYRLHRLAEDAKAPIDRDLCNIDVSILPHPEPNKDVAVFSLPELAALPAVPLGSHLDDWVNDHDFVLNDVLVLGFPPIPLSDKPVLVASSGQINAVVDLINVDHVHFIVSVPPKGGFSGGVVLSEWDFALGVVTSSLVKNEASVELGYLTVLTVEPILECLAAHGLLPRELAVMWDGLFTAKTYHFGVPEKSWAQAFVETDRDGHRTRLKFACPTEDTVAKAVDAVLQATSNITIKHHVIPEDVHEFLFDGDYNSLEESLERAKDAVCAIFMAEGFLPVHQPKLIARTLDPPKILLATSENSEPSER